MPNAWVTHVKQFAADSNLSYGCALSLPECKDTYKIKIKIKKNQKQKNQKKKKEQKFIRNIKKQSDQ